MRAAPAYVALAVLAALYLPPWQGLVGSFPEHMLRHMGLVAVVAPLVVMALPDFARDASLPVMAGAFVEFAVVWGWHLPALHGWAQGSGTGLVLEQLMFLAAGWAVWASALTSRAPLAGAGGLFLTSMHMTLLGALLILAPGDLYTATHHRAPDLAGQQIGGMLMLAIGTPVYLLGALGLARRSLLGEVT